MIAKICALLNVKKRKRAAKHRAKRCVMAAANIAKARAKSHVRDAGKI